MVFRAGERQRLTKLKPKFTAASYVRHAEQFDRREGETATVLSAFFVTLNLCVSVLPHLNSIGGPTGKKGSDKGIDGIKVFVDDNSGKAKRVIVQVRSGHVRSGDILDHHDLLL